MKTTMRIILMGMIVMVFSSITLTAQTADDSRVKVLDESNFTKNTKSGVVVVDFYADWCKPCKAMAPILEQVAFETNGKISFAKLNVDNAKQLSSQYNVTGIPCLIVFRNGKEVERFVGFQQKDVLMQKLAKYME
ncbi:MAG TPA: thioredoxin [Bacteroidales bacterium]|nr:thioredoxin [Bacteroidales bacterium]HOE04202.1 thioredoxin [Bacteroidales bacterium]HQL70867.1 thioredoxin [Bacteroidales bacterium]